VPVGQRALRTGVLRTSVRSDGGEVDHPLFLERAASLGQTLSRQVVDPGAAMALLRSCFSGQEGRAVRAPLQRAASVCLDIFLLAGRQTTFATHVERLSSNADEQSGTVSPDPVRLKNRKIGIRHALVASLDSVVGDVDLTEFVVPSA